MTDKKIKIFFFIPSLTAGGAERVMLFLAKNLSFAIFDIKLIVIGYEKDTIHSTHGVEVMYLNENQVQNAMLKIIRLFKVHKPDIVFGTLTHINYSIGLLAYFFPKIVCVARETYIISEGKKHAHKKSFFTKIKDMLIERLAIKRINYVICQSNDMQKDLLESSNYNPKKLLVINNPVSNEILVKKPNPVNGTHVKLITVGRLAKQKGYERILYGLSKLKTDFTYTIIGDGEEKEKLFELAKELNINHKINHIPLSKEVYKHLAENHIYLQGSFYEGFPNALIESLASGTPAIVFEAPGGINEIMLDGANGFIVKNEEEFREKLHYLKSNLNEFSPEEVAKVVKNKFGADKILQHYENFFQEIVV